MAIDDPRSALGSALRTSPRAAADVLWDLVGRGAVPERGLVSIEWLADVYSESLSEPERSCFRDGLVLLLEDTSQRPPFERTAVAALASDIGLLGVARARTEERLELAAFRIIDSGHSKVAAPLLSFLAEEGQVRPTETWSDIYLASGRDDAVLGPCIDGVRHHGSLEALRWIGAFASDHPALDELFAEFLPSMVRDDRAGVDAFLNDSKLEESLLRFRRDLYTALGRYELRLPQGGLLAEQETDFDADVEARRIEVLRSFDQIDGDPSNTVIGALHAYQDADANPLPVFVMGFMDGSAVPSEATASQSGGADD